MAQLRLPAVVFAFVVVGFEAGQAGLDPAPLGTTTAAAAAARKGSRRVHLCNARERPGTVTKRRRGLSFQAQEHAAKQHKGTTSRLM